MGVKILAFAGSARSGSHNKWLVEKAAAFANEQGATVSLIDLKDYPLPLYDEDVESAEGLPENAKRLKELFWGHQGLLLACPEYNSSITPLLKNTIDWVSRSATPDEEMLSCYQGKVAALLSASPGGYGGMRGLVTVRSILSNINVLVLPKQFCLAQVHKVRKEGDSSLDKLKPVVQALVDTTSALN